MTIIGEHPNNTPNLGYNLEPTSRTVSRLRLVDGEYQAIVRIEIQDSTLKRLHQFWSIKGAFNSLFLCPYYTSR